MLPKTKQTLPFSLAMRRFPSVDCIQTTSNNSRRRAEWDHMQVHRSLGMEDTPHQGEREPKLLLGRLFDCRDIRTYLARIDVRRFRECHRFV